MTYWEDWRLRSIETADVQDWIDKLVANEYAAATVRSLVSLFSASMTAAVQRRNISGLSTNPRRDLAEPTLPPKRKRYLTRQQVRTIAQHLLGIYRDVMLILVASGLRIGELQGLHREDVHLAEVSIPVRNVWMHAVGSIKEYPKSEIPRTVPIPEWIVPVFERLLARLEVASCGLPHWTVNGELTGCHSGLLINNVAGDGLFDRHNYRGRQWKAAIVEANKVDPSIGNPTLHDLRHTFASLFLQDGGTLEILSKILGHSKQRTTEMYADLDQTHLDAGLEILNSWGSDAHGKARSRKGKKVKKQQQGWPLTG